MSESTTRSVERALNFLAVICERGKVSLADSARACELAPSTALRLLRTLESTGFVRRDENGNFSPGGRIIQLGAQALSNESLIDLTRPAMERLVEAGGESVYLSIVGHRATALYIAIAEGTHSVRHTSWVGSTIPLTGTAAGRALSGTVPGDGYTLVQSGVERDVTAIAAPIRAGHRALAALSIVAPSYRIDAEEAARLGALLAAEVAGLSTGLSRPASSASSVGEEDVA